MTAYVNSFGAVVDDDLDPDEPIPFLPSSVRVPTVPPGAARVPTLPDIDPTTLPMVRVATPVVNAPRACYFCGKPADDFVNDDIPTCGGHGRK